MQPKRILLSHGSGGKAMHDFIKEILVRKLRNPTLQELSDSAIVDYKERIAFTTDSFVVSPLKFPGADIGKLAVCGTINDLAVAGAQPEYLSLALIIEEGLEYEIVEEITDSIAQQARQAGVQFVTGDLKVVEKGSCDKIFINTSGIGRIVSRARLSARAISAGDKIIVNGEIAEHGLAVLSKRQNLGLDFNIKSDCAALNGLIIPLVKKTDAIKFMRDPTRGGIATTLNEIAETADAGIIIEEKMIPVSSRVRAACELLGIDPLYVANEGKVVMVVKEKEAGKILALVRKHALGRKAQIIGTVVESPRARVVLNTALGTRRIVDMLTSEPLPRIC